MPVLRHTNSILYMYIFSVRSRSQFNGERTFLHSPDSHISRDFQSLTSICLQRESHETFNARFDETDLFTHPHPHRNSHVKVLIEENRFPYHHRIATEDSFFSFFHLDSVIKCGEYDDFENFRIASGNEECRLK